MEWQRVVSTCVSGVGYSVATQTLRIEFVRGGRHEYLGVPEGEYAALMRAESIGVHVNRCIKGCYQHRCCGAVP